MDLEGLNSLERAGQEEALPEYIEEQEAPPTLVEEAQPCVPEELSPSNIVIDMLSELTPQERWLSPSLVAGKGLIMLPSWFIRETF